MADICKDWMVLQCSQWFTTLFFPRSNGYSTPCHTLLRSILILYLHVHIGLVYAAYRHRACYMFGSYDFPLFDHPKNIWWIFEPTNFEPPIMYIFPNLLYLPLSCGCLYSSANLSAIECMSDDYTVRTDNCLVFSLVIWTNRLLSQHRCKPKPLRAFFFIFCLNG